MSSEHERSDQHIDRRTILATTAGMIGLGGGSSSESTETSTTTTTGGALPGDTADPTTVTDQQNPTTVTDQQTETAGGGTTTQGGDCENLGMCPMLPGWFTRFDPGAGPLPVSFRYPSVLSHNMGYDLPDDFESGNLVSGRLVRCPDKDATGEIALAIDVDYVGRPQESRDDFYLTEMTVGVSLLLTDVETVTDACASNLRTTLKQSVESLEPNPQTTFEQYIKF